ncbi:hypothetical protein EYV94_16945 [Puteibacter caeruleilacunae]|nr:hypothetical protein EYV94_16945 [Puteibacter caeruleilacunae]
MKKSNKLLIAYLILNIGGVFLLYVFSELHGPDVRTIQASKPITYHERSLPPFSVIVADSGMHFSVEHDYDHKVYLHNTGGMKVPKFKISNDTLYVTDVGLPADVKPRFFSPKVTYIEGKQRNRINFLQLQTDEFSIKIKGGRVDGSFDPNIEPVVHIEANNSRIRLNDSSMKVLDLKLDNTECNATKNKIKEIKGSLHYLSFLTVDLNSKMKLITDDTSRVITDKE